MESCVAGAAEWHRRLILNDTISRCVEHLWVLHSASQWLGI
jgi:hypothetical protein